MNINIFKTKGVIKISQTEQVKVKCEPKFQIYYSDDTNFGIYKCELIENLEGKVDVSKDNTFIIKGKMPKLNLDVIYIVYCSPVVDRKYGLQYDFINLETKKPNTSEEQKNFLSTLLTENQLSEIFKVYDYPIDEIINETFDANKVYGFGEKNFPPIRDRIMQNFVLYELLSELGKYNITYKQIKKIYNQYQSSDLAIQKIKDDPYILYRDIEGIGFRKADKIAEEIFKKEEGQFKYDDPRRIRACIRFILEDNQNQGNTWMNFNSLKEKFCDLIGNLDINLEEFLNNYNEFYYENEKVALYFTYKTELNIAYELYRISNNYNELKSRIANFNIDNFIKEQEKIQGFEYTDKQKETFYNIFNTKINMLNGGAGCGKTQNLNGILNMLDRLDVSYALCSFSGKAAKVMSEYTDRQASTIHRLLQWTPEGFNFNKENKLPYSLIVIDEASQLDVNLFNSLVKAVRDNAVLLFIFDLAQLEPIRQGNVLGDMAYSDLFTVCTLDKVFRQALDSGIIDLCTRVRRGKKFLNNNDTGSINFGKNKDAHIRISNKENTKQKVIKVYKEMVNKFGADNTIVLSPTRKGEVGTDLLNNELQEIVNPKNNNKNEIKHNDKIFRENDMVIHIVNNYNAIWLDNNFIPICPEKYTGIFNGETGKIIKIGDKELFVKYDEKIIRYSNVELDQLEHSYALTTFKYQGSQCENVIFLFDNRHFIFAKRSMIYTSFSRSQKRLVAIVEPKMINIAIDSNVIKKKKTFLKDLLLDVFNNNKLMQEKF